MDTRLLTRRVARPDNEPCRPIPSPLVFVMVALISFYCVWIATLMEGIPPANDRSGALLSAPRPDSTPAPIAATRPAGNRCGRCGVVESVRKVDQRNAPVGRGSHKSVMGNPDIGEGFGGNLMAVLGVVAGALTGHRFDDAARSPAFHQITVRFDDGSSRVLTSTVAPAWAVGDRVKVVNGRIRPDAGEPRNHNAALLSIP